MPPDDELLPRWVPATVCVAGVVVAAVACSSTLPAHHWWGRLAVVGYGFGLATTLHPSTRRWWWAVCIAACGVAPLALLVVGRARGWHHVAQSEVDVIESAARRLLRHGTPYQDPADMSARQAATNYSYFPYLPALVVAGIPRALVGRHWFTDARCWMLAIETTLATATARRLSPRARAGFVALIASPVVTLLVAAGGHDVFIASFLVLGALGVAAALGGAVAMSLLAWPLAGPFGFVPRFDLRRVAVAAGVLALTAWPVLVDPGAAWANLVRFPAGDTPARSPADAPSIGRALRHVPGGSTITTLLLVAVVVALAASVLRRPPATVGDAAGRAALAFLALAVTVPATRTGYLVHPLALGVLWWAERPSTPGRTRTSHRRLHITARPPAT